MFGLGGGIHLSDLRDIVAATNDYDDNSRVILEPNKVTVIQTRESYWIKRGRDDS